MERHALSYGYCTTVGEPPSEVLRRAKEALEDEGFAVLFEVNLGASLRARIGVDVGAYAVLGVCDAWLASVALGLDRDAGLLLPWHVVVYGTPDPRRSVLGVADVERMLALSECNALQHVAIDASMRLRRALRAVEGSPQTFAPPPPASPRLAWETASATLTGITRSEPAPLADLPLPAEQFI